MSLTVNEGRRPATRRWIGARFATACLGILILTSISGCGWLFGKQEKPMHVEVVLNGTSDLNFDGNSAHTIRVKVYLLTSTAGFTGTDKDVFFNPSYHDQLASVLGNDILDSGSVIVSPSGTATVELEGNYFKVKKAKPVLCAIADFYRSAGVAQERLALNIPKKTEQRVKIEVGRDFIKKAR